MVESSCTFMSVQIDYACSIVVNGCMHLYICYDSGLSKNVGNWIDFELAREE